MPSYQIKTFGCQMNESDSERVASILEQCGFQVCEETGKPDLYIVNTCSVRQKSEDKAYGFIVQKKKDFPKALVAVTGCMVRQTGDKTNSSDSLLKYDPIDLVFRIEDIARLPKLLEPLFPDHDFSDFIEGFGSGSLENYFAIHPRVQNRSKVYVPIMQGCDKFCTYCIVPYTRGRELSRPMDDVIRECEAHVANGAVEITLLGQNVNSYSPRSALGATGTDGGGSNHWYEPQEASFLTPERADARSDSVPTSRDGVSNQMLPSLARKKKLAFSSLASFSNKEKCFAQLLRKIDTLADKGLSRLRFTSPHPQDFTDEVIETLATMRTSCPYVHLPAQHGSNYVLRAMNRNYTVEKYEDIIARIRKRIPGVTIATDIIVGFPGETKEDFQLLCDFARRMKFDFSYTAIFSPRKNTPASRMSKDFVPDEEKNRRFHEFDKIIEGTSWENREAAVGKTWSVLVEKCEPHPDKLYLNSGRSREFFEVFFPAGRNMFGKEVSVKITSRDGYVLRGELI